MSPSLDGSLAATSEPAVLIPPPAGERFVDVAGGSGLCAALSTSGVVCVFGDSASVVPLTGLRGVTHFSGAPSHVLALDVDGRLCRLSAAIESCGDRNALPLMQPATQPYLIYGYSGLSAPCFLC